MKSLEDILYDLYSEKEGRAELNDLNSTSRAAKWRMWLYNVAFNIWTLYKRYEIHKSELTELIKTKKPHTARWYRDKALNYMHNTPLITDSDVFDLTGLSDDEIDAKKNIKYAAAVPAGTDRTGIIKIATEREDGTLWQVPNEVYEGFLAYVAEFRGFCDNIRVINYRPDKLKLRIRIVRNPIYLDTNGMNDLAKFPVQDAIQEFQKELPFNGELSLQKLIDKIQAVQGVEDLVLDYAQTAWIDPTTNDYGDLQTVDISKVAVSGYFEVQFESEDENEQQFVSDLIYGA